MNSPTKALPSEYFTWIQNKYNSFYFVISGLVCVTCREVRRVRFCIQWTCHTRVLHRSRYVHCAPNYWMLNNSAFRSQQAFREALASVGRGNRSYGLSPLSEAEAARLLVAMGNSANAAVLGDPGAAPVNPVAAIGPVFDSLAAAVGRPPLYAGGRVLMPVGGGSDTWRHDVVALVLREDHPQIDYPRLVAALDFPECSLSSPHAFQFVVSVVLAANGGVFPTAELLRKPWSNTRAQIDALRNAVQVGDFCFADFFLLMKASTTSFVLSRLLLTRYPSSLLVSPILSMLFNPSLDHSTASGIPMARGVVQIYTSSS